MHSFEACCDQAPGVWLDLVSTPAKHWPVLLDAEVLSFVMVYSFFLLLIGGIQVTSEFTAVNFPAFHIAPVNLKLPASSVATVPMVNGTAVTSDQADSIQAPSASVMNFTLQHLGLIPANLQMSANQVLRSGPVCQGAEHASLVSESVGFKQEKAMQNVLPPYGDELNGKSVSAASLQQVRELLNNSLFQIRLMVLPECTVAHKQWGILHDLVTGASQQETTPSNLELTLY